MPQVIGMDGRSLDHRSMQTNTRRRTTSRLRARANRLPNYPMPSRPCPLLVCVVARESGRRTGASRFCNVADSSEEARSTAQGRRERRSDSEISLTSTGTGRERGRARGPVTRLCCVSWCHGWSVDEEAEARLCQPAPELARAFCPAPRLDCDRHLNRAQPSGPHTRQHARAVTTPAGGARPGGRPISSTGKHARTHARAVHLRSPPRTALSEVWRATRAPRSLASDFPRRPTGRLRQCCRGPSVAPSGPNPPGHPPHKFALPPLPWRGPIEHLFVTSAARQSRHGKPRKFVAASGGLSARSRARGEGGRRTPNYIRVDPPT